jgi:hypothetical protein
MSIDRQQHKMSLSDKKPLFLAVWHRPKHVQWTMPPLSR